MGALWVEESHLALTFVFSDDGFFGGIVRILEGVLHRYLRRRARTGDYGELEKL